MNISSNTAVFPSVNAEAPLFQSSQNVRGFWSCAVRTAGRGKHLSGAGNRECWTGWLEILPIRLRKPPQKWAYLGMPNISCISWTTEVSTVEICLKWGGGMVERPHLDILNMSPRTGSSSIRSRTYSVWSRPLNTQDHTTFASEIPFLNWVQWKASNHFIQLKIAT